MNGTIWDMSSMSGSAQVQSLIREKILAMQSQILVSFENIADV